MSDPSIAHLPAPLSSDVFSLFHTGVYDDPSINVYINHSKDFAFLSPVPATTYDTYKPRVSSLGLSNYKNQSEVYSRRYEKISTLIGDHASILEIGSSDAGFLALVHQDYPDIILHSVEPDQSTRPIRDQYSWLHQFDSIDATLEANLKVDLVSLFHVFEHIHQPSFFFHQIKQLLSPSGFLLIEVPSLADPLLSLYSCSAYHDFYFQRQHPFIYSSSSLSRVLQFHGFNVLQSIPHQRYGLENHLQWITHSSPGGNTHYKSIFHSIDDTYRLSLESSSFADSVIILAQLMP